MLVPVISARRLGRMDPFRAGMVWLGLCVVVAIGAPLLGSGVLVGFDELYRYSPWASTGQVSSTSVPVGDTFDWRYPALLQARERLWTGDLALWDPLIGGGSELLAVPNIAVLHPIGLLVLVAPLPVGFAWAAAAAAVWAGGFTALFLRRLGVGAVGATAGGVVFAFSGFQVVWLNWPQTLVGATVPFVFWSVERLRQERTARSWVLVSLGVFWMIAGGFPAILVHTVYLLAFFGAVTAFADARRGGSGRLSIDPRTLMKSSVGLGVAAIAAVNGLLLASAQLVPFLGMLDRVDLTYRETAHLSNLPLKSVATTAFPFAFGSPNLGRYYGPLNSIEAISFVGVLTLPLVGIAVLRPRGRLRPGARTVFVASVVVGAALLFGPTDSVPGLLPGWSNSFVGRLRCVWAFAVACSAAMGVDSLTRRDVEDGAVERRWTAAVALISVLLLVPGAWRLWQTAALEAGDVGTQRSIVLGLAIVALGGVSMAAAPRRLRALVVLALLSSQSVLFAREFWPRSDPADFYPTTPAHEFLRDSQGDQRTAFDGLAFYPGTTSAYGLRSLTGHAFFGERWGQYLVALQADAFRYSPTFPRLSLLAEDRMSNPLLDRAAVRYGVTGPDLPVIGDRQPQPVTAAEFSLEGSAWSAALPETPLRGLQVLFDGMIEAGDVIEVRVIDSGGEVRSRRRFPAGVIHGSFELAVADAVAPSSLRIVIEALGGQPLDLPGPISFRPIPPQDDGLEIVFAVDSIVYERTDAVPFVRFVDQAVMVDSSESWVEGLEGLGLNAVQVENGDLIGSYGSGEVLSVDQDDPDRLVVEVETAEQSLLVVAAGLGDVWVATVDGEPATIVWVDHAMSGVRVPPGAQEVLLEYSPPGAGAGIAGTGLGIANLIAAAAVGLRRRSVPSLDEATR